MCLYQSSQSHGMIEAYGTVEVKHSVIVGNVYGSIHMIHMDFGSITFLNCYYPESQQNNFVLRKPFYKCFKIHDDK